MDFIQNKGLYLSLNELADTLYSRTKLEESIDKYLLLYHVLYYVEQAALFAREVDDPDPNSLILAEARKTFDY